MKKKATASKTVWVNVMTLVVGTIGFVAGHDVIADYPSVVAALVAAQGVVNVVLRFLTWEPISISGE
jgi:hypothetical protein